MLGYSDAAPLVGSDLIYRTLSQALQCLKAAVVPRATRAMSVNVFRQSELYLHIYLLERTTMEYTSSETPPQYADDREREATELRNVGGNLARSNGSIRPSEGATHGSIRSNEGYLQSLRMSTALFWKRQVSATVPHEACRDHFGTYISPSNASSST